MKSVKVDSTDLDHALKVTRTTVGSSSDISSHYVFRSRGGSLEVLSYDGRTFSSSIVGHTKVDEDVSFTVEARRIHVLLDSVGANQPLDISFSDSEVTVRTSRGKVTFSSLDPSVFPSWDDVLSGATLTAKILSDRLHAAFSHARQFISDQESKEPHLCVAEFRDGVLLSTDKLALSLVKIPGMEGSKLRVYVKDISNILSFLAAAHDVEGFLGDTVEAQARTVSGRERELGDAQRRGLRILRDAPDQFAQVHARGRMHDRDVLAAKRDRPSRGRAWRRPGMVAARQPFDVRCECRVGALQRVPIPHLEVRVFEGRRQLIPAE